VLPPREELVDAEARDGGGLLGAVLEGADQPVAGRPLALVDLAGRAPRAPVVRAQLEQGSGGEEGLAGAELATVSRAER
jgi:hypothetical protein